MKVDKKLEHFYQAVIDDATMQSDSIINEYKESLKTIFEDQKRELEQKAEILLKVETDSLIRQKNKSLSTETFAIRRKINDKNIELKDKLFDDIYVKLIDFMKTPAYEELLIKQIKAALKTARGAAITIYINESDNALHQKLQEATDTILTISTMNFLGGTRAVIHEKHILIDNSFSTKLAEEKNVFQF